MERVDESLGAVIGPSLLAQANELSGRNRETMLTIPAITIGTAQPKKYEAFRCALDSNIALNANFLISQ